MKFSKETNLFISLVMLAKAHLEMMSDDDIQFIMGSDYYHELKQYLKDVYGLYERGELHD